MTNFAGPPPVAAWQHVDARTGFEVARFMVDGGTITIDGTTTAAEAGEAWIVDYTIRLDHTWTTQSARVRTRSAAGERTIALTAVAPGRWSVNGQPAPHLDGCRDVDLEASAMTNAFPIHRLDLEVDQTAPAAAAYVRVISATVERLEQDYVRRADQHGRYRYDYTAPLFGFTSRLVYDRHGLVLDYPGIARRAYTPAGRVHG